MGKSLIEQSLQKDPMKACSMLAKSDLTPAGYRNKPEDIFIAISYGHELGLNPLASLQGIAVINGKPSVYGDAMLALCRKHPEFEDIQESISGSGENMKATCKIKRQGQSWSEYTFTISMARKAGLLNKKGPWQTHLERMMQMRARGFVLRDVFADALGGVITTEEAEDYPEPRKIINPNDALNKLKDAPVIEDKTNEENAQNEPIEEVTEPVSNKPSEEVVPFADYVVRQINGKVQHCGDPRTFRNTMVETLNRILQSKKHEISQKIAFVNELQEINDEGMGNLEVDDKTAFSELVQDIGKVLVGLEKKLEEK